MRLLGIRAGLPLFRWDLVYLLSNLVSDDRPEVQAFAPQVEAAIAEIKAEREAHEAIEDAAIITTARRGKRDDVLDALIIRFGGIARVTDKALYKALFPRHNPSKTARLALADEVSEVGRILGELGALPAHHPLRAEYEAALTTARTALVGAMADATRADTDAALSRSRIERFKLRLDQIRVEVHGRLLVLLKDKAAADAFFRSSTKAPGSGAEGSDTPTEASAT